MKKTNQEILLSLEPSSICGGCINIAKILKGIPDVGAVEWYCCKIASVGRIGTQGLKSHLLCMTITNYEPGCTTPGKKKSFFRLSPSG